MEVIRIFCDISEKIAWIIKQLALYFTILLYATERNTGCIYNNKENKLEKVVPISVNYHFTRKCNYQCGFCFHTAKTSYMLNLEDAKNGLRKLKAAGEFYLFMYMYVCCQYLKLKYWRIEYY